MIDDCLVTQVSYKTSKEEESRVFEHTFSCGMTLTANKDDFNFCPYCGRVIKVIERRNRGIINPNTGLRR